MISGTVLTVIRISFFIGYIIVQLFQKVSINCNGNVEDPTDSRAELSYYCCYIVCNSLGDSFFDVLYFI